MHKNMITPFYIFFALTPATLTKALRGFCQFLHTNVGLELQIMALLLP
jgi:hypothetical protein